MSKAPSIFSIVDDKQRIESKMNEKQRRIDQLQAQYDALHEDYLHAISDEPLSLKGQIIALIDADDDSIMRLQAISAHYDAKLIIPKSEKTVCYAIQVADHVLCLENCPNQELCNTTYTNCAKYRKPVHVIPDDSNRHFSRQLASLAVEVKSSVPQSSDQNPKDYAAT